MAVTITRGPTYLHISSTTLRTSVSCLTAAGVRCSLGSLDCSRGTAVSGSMRCISRDSRGRKELRGNPDGIWWTLGHGGWDKHALYNCGSWMITMRPHHNNLDRVAVVCRITPGDCVCRAVLITSSSAFRLSAVLKSGMPLGCLLRTSTL